DKEAQKEATRLSELVDLAPFDNIAVIQKRFLPKLNRFEVSGSGMVTTNNAFFNTFGLAVNLAFFFNVTFGVEGTYAFMTSSERRITVGLVDNQNIDTRSLVQPESFYTDSLKWSPIYGKMAWFQQKIVPFDFYFTPGFGMSQT